MAQHVKRMSRRAFMASAGAGGGALIYYPLRALGQEGGIYLDQEAYDRINAIKASANQEFTLLFLKPELINQSAAKLQELQSLIEDYLPLDLLLEESPQEGWTLTNYSPNQVKDLAPIRSPQEVASILEPQAIHPCFKAVIRVLADIFNIDEEHIEQFEEFIQEQSLDTLIEGIAESLEKDNENKVKSYIELLINEFSISDAIKQAIQAYNSPVTRALRVWIRNRAIPFVGLYLALLDVGVSIIQQREHILACVNEF